MRFRSLVFVLLAGLTGCANVPLERGRVEKIASLDLVRVETPPIQVMTFMQAWAKTQGVGLIPAAIAEAQGKVLFSAPAIPDLGALLAERLREQVPQQVPWWPRMIARGDPVKPGYLQPTGAWLLVEIDQLEIAPAPLRTVFAVVQVSLKDSGPKPLWLERKAFSGVVHGGEKIDTDKLNRGDASQLGREIERAADWLAKEIVATMR